jgi:hypothetical protein
LPSGGSRVARADRLDQCQRQTDKRWLLLFI